MTKKLRHRCMPDGITTDDEDKYADAWLELGKEVEGYFPGFIATQFNPHVVIEKRRQHPTDDNCYITDYRIELPMEAIEALRQAFNNKKGN